MSINNREDANKYYQMINGLVDDYIDRWKIRPSNLKRYLQPGSERFRKFLERNKLKDIKGSEIILRDVIEDRAHMEKDGVITFESFKLFESEEFKIGSLKQCLYKGVNKSTTEMEKILADHFDTNLSSIDVEDSEKHQFKIENWEGDDIKVIIYSDEEIKLIKENMIEFIFDELSKKKVNITESIEIDLNEIINKEVYQKKIEEKFTEKFTKDLITECLGENWEFKSEEKKHFIWIK